MHELSIALSIVEIVEGEVRKLSEAGKVEKIVLEIGKLAGVQIEALNFAWSEAVKSTVLENAEYIVESKVSIARCAGCEREFEIQELYDSCPYCHCFGTRVIQGKEIKIKYLTIV